MRVSSWLLVAFATACVVLACLPAASRVAANDAAAAATTAGAGAAGAGAGAATGAGAKAAAAAGAVKAKAKAKAKGPAPAGKGKAPAKGKGPGAKAHANAKHKQKVKTKSATGQDGWKWEDGAPAGVGAAGSAGWTAEDFLNSAKAKAKAAKLGATGGSSSGSGAGSDDDEGDDEEEVTKSWEEEEDIATWEEEEPEHMPKFITLEQLNAKLGNDSSRLGLLKRHQLLRIGRSLLRDPKFNDCLVTLVQALVDTARASTCAPPDINDLAAAEVPPPGLTLPTAVAATGVDPAAATGANIAAVNTVDAIVAAATGADGEKKAEEDPSLFEENDTPAAALLKASGTQPAGRQKIRRNLPGEERAQDAARKAQRQGLGSGSGAVADVDSTGSSERVIQPTPYNPNRTVTYNIIGRTNVFPPHPTVHAPVTPQTEVFDVAVVGCGLSGLTTMYRIRNLSVVCLEWSEEPGGIAAQQTKDNITWATGAAYAPVPYAAILDLWHEIGLPKPEEIELGKPRDSFWVDKNLYLGIWEEALDDLPDDWYEFKSMIDALDFAGLIGVPPLERESKKAKIFDGISAGELIENFGTKLKTMLDLYCRSALGSVCADISAMAFLDFYSDELYERVAFPGGTGAVTKRLVELIVGQNPDRIRTGVWVYDVQHLNDTTVQLRYVDTRDGKGITSGTPHTILAKRVIMATPVNIGAKIIKDLPDHQRAAMESVEHMHYLVHNVHTPLSYFHSSYDTWTADVTFTDIIVARWQEATLSNTPVPREQAILSVYQPLPRKYWKTALNDGEVRALSEEMLVDLEKLLPGYKTAESIAIDTHRWPGSINILRPGLATGAEGAAMRANHGRIIFAGSNLGIPSLEEAIERGLIAAKELFRLVAADAAADAADATLSAASAEEQEAAAQKAAVDAASSAVSHDSKP